LIFLCEPPPRFSLRYQARIDGRTMYVKLGIHMVERAAPRPRSRRPAARDPPSRGDRNGNRNGSRNAPKKQQQQNKKQQPKKKPAPKKKPEPKKKQQPKKKPAPKKKKAPAAKPQSREQLDAELAAYHAARVSSSNGDAAAAAAATE
jgi:outer membrane biosynthesis protein TonB